mmetsp:Transcript_11775/g.21451  ORF Transcript_11775/g.21451 Transcript_11775/m.21451 type:complete len:86 (-) Transcript_11775:50-307(-)
MICPILLGKRSFFSKESIRHFCTGEKSQNALENDDDVGCLEANKQQNREWILPGMLMSPLELANVSEYNSHRNWAVRIDCSNITI